MEEFMYKSMIVVFGTILLISMVCVFVYCYKEWKKSKENKERQEYELAIRQHEKKVWAIKSEPPSIKVTERTQISESDRHNNMVKVPSYSAIYNKPLSQVE
jgi:heme/copper-type cytochrome/quinol oxidase subunit 1